jgi:hypothetical protein
MLDGAVHGYTRVDRDPTRPGHDGDPENVSIGVDPHPRCDESVHPCPEFAGDTAGND